MKLDALTLVLPYYCNPGMLREQQRVWRTYGNLGSAVHVVIVDDGSPKGHAAKALEFDGAVASLRLYRTKVDVRWNWLFCRNLGVHVAETEWVFLTDIDHVVPVDTLRAILTEPHERNCAYRFARQAASGKPIKPHPNTWLMTTDLYDRVGGYDERLSGYYGTDAEFRSRVELSAAAVVMRTWPVLLYSRQEIADADTTRYGRKEARDDEPLAQLKAEREQVPNWKPLRVTFPYERVR